MNDNLFFLVRISFVEFVKTCHEWEIPEDQTPITDEQKKKFKDWLEHF